MCTVSVRPLNASVLNEICDVMLGIKSVGEQGGEALRSLLQWDTAALLGRYMELCYFADGYKRITAPVTLMALTR